jgi:hypothetical protein
VPDTTPAEHGSIAGVSAHKRAGTKLCTPCYDVNNDYKQAWRIARGETVRVLVPVDVLRAILHGAPPDQALTCLGGPQTLHALRDGTVPRG